MAKVVEAPIATRCDAGSSPTIDFFFLAVQNSKVLACMLSSLAWPSAQLACDRFELHCLLRRSFLATSATATRLLRRYNMRRVQRNRVMSKRAVLATMTEADGPQTPATLKGLPTRTVPDADVRLGRAIFETGHATSFVMRCLAGTSDVEELGATRDLVRAVLARSEVMLSPADADTLLSVFDDHEDAESPSAKRYKAAGGAASPSKSATPEPDTASAADHMSEDGEGRECDDDDDIEDKETPKRARESSAPSVHSDLAAATATASVVTERFPTITSLQLPEPIAKGRGGNKASLVWDKAIHVLRTHCDDLRAQLAAVRAHMDGAQVSKGESRDVLSRHTVLLRYARTIGVASAIDIEHPAFLGPKLGNARHWVNTFWTKITTLARDYCSAYSMLRKTSTALQQVPDDAKATAVGNAATILAASLGYKPKKTNSAAFMAIVEGVSAQDGTAVMRKVLDSRRAKKSKASSTRDEASDSSTPATASFNARKAALIEEQEWTEPELVRLLDDSIDVVHAELDNIDLGALAEDMNPQFQGQLRRTLIRSRLHPGDEIGPDHWPTILRMLVRTQGAMFREDATYSASTSTTPSSSSSSSSTA